MYRLRLQPLRAARDFAFRTRSSRMRSVVFIHRTYGKSVNMSIYGCQGEAVEVPELIEGGAGGEGCGVLAGVGGPGAEAGEVVEEGGGGFGVGFGGEGGDDAAGAFGEDGVAGAALVGDEDGETGGLGFDDDAAEGVGGAGEDEEVAGGEGGGEVVTAFDAGEDGGGVGEAGLHFGEVGAVADDDEFGGGSLVMHVEEGVGEEGEIFFFGDAADVEEDGGFRFGAPLAAEGVGAVGGGEGALFDAAADDVDAVGVEAVGDEVVAGAA